MPHSKELHRTDRIGWLRASVLGANDGIISISALMVGVAAAASGPREVIVAGVAGLVAGAVSMAAGEYVSVSSQSDSERAEIDREGRELSDDPAHELNELTGIYVKRGLDATLAEQVAMQLTAHNALAAHARDELGLSEALSARPLQAAVASAVSFAIGAALPLLVGATASPRLAVIAISATSLLCLSGLGALSAMIGGAPPVRAAVRVTSWGALAMGLSAGVGWVFGLAV